MKKFISRTAVAAHAEGPMVGTAKNERISTDPQLSLARRTIDHFNKRIELSSKHTRTPSGQIWTS
jgi:hypothetical protein